jgi:hypothetical protein
LVSSRVRGSFSVLPLGGLSNPILDCAYVGMSGVKPKPPSAVAARGLTPDMPTKRGSVWDVSRGVAITASL